LPLLLLLWLPGRSERLLWPVPGLLWLRFWRLYWLPFLLPLLLPLRH
jgi:hypothetical protein